VKSAANDFGGDGGASRLMSRIALGSKLNQGIEFIVGA